MTSTPFIGLRKVLGDDWFEIGNRAAVGNGRGRYAGSGRPLAGEGFCFPPGLAARRAGSERPRMPVTRVDVRR
jgi:hypothetical protein